MAALFTPGLMEQLAKPRLVAVLRVNVTQRAAEVCRIERRRMEKRPAGKETN